MITEHVPSAFAAVASGTVEIPRASDVFGWSSVRTRLPSDAAC